jgi:hypothetical protein
LNAAAQACNRGRQVCIVLKRRCPLTALPALLGLALVALTVASQDLIPRRNLDELHVSAPRLHFLTGRSLQRLHDGVSVPFDFQLSIAADTQANVVERALDRFVVSYDLWEEKFSVVRPRNLRRSSPRLSASAAESWCVDNLFVPISKLPENRNLWARLEIRASEMKQSSPLDEPGTGISLTTLIDIFSRPTRSQQEHWSVESAPFRIGDVK